MWVYTPASDSPKLPHAEPVQQPVQEAFSFSEKSVPQEGSGACMEKPAIPVERTCCNRKPEMLHFPAGMLWYGVGLACAGILLQTVQHPYLKLLGENLRMLFSQKPVHLFSALFLSAFLILSLMFLLGFCTFGRCFGKVLLLLYGIGTGVCCLGLLQTYGWRGWLLFALLPGVYATILSWCLCRVAGSGGRLSASLRNLLRAKENPPACRASGRTLVDTYLMTCCMQGFCCMAIAFGSSWIVPRLF